MKTQTKIIAFAVAGLFVLTGTYNAVVINSESHIESEAYAKRLDEIYGVVIPGRKIAGTSHWKKLSPQRINIKKEMVQPEPVIVKSAPEAAPEPEPSVAQELNLTLIEVINPNKWKNGLTNNQFNGSLASNNGVIESLTVSLPNGEGVSVSFSEMTGNVFEYDLNGEVYSGMMYQVDQNGYMVTLTNGPLEGTRLRFSSQTPQVEQTETQQVLAENNIETGSFGSEAVNPESIISNDQELQQDAIQAQTFNLQNSQAM